MDLVALSSGFQWSQHRTHLGIAKKVNGLSLLVPNPEYQAPPMMKKDEKKEIAKDQSVSTNSTQSHNTNTMNAQSTDVRLQKFNVLLNAQTIDLGKYFDLIFLSCDIDCYSRFIKIISVGRYSFSFESKNLEIPFWISSCK